MDKQQLPAVSVNESVNKAPKEARGSRRAMLRRVIHPPPAIGKFDPVFHLGDIELEFMHVRRSSTPERRSPAGPLPGISMTARCLSIDCPEVWPNNPPEASPRPAEGRHRTYAKATALNWPVSPRRGTPTQVSE